MINKVLKGRRVISKSCPGGWFFCASPRCGDLPIMTYIGRLLLKGELFSDQVNKGVGISHVEVYEWVGNSV